LPYWKDDSMRRAVLDAEAKLIESAEPAIESAPLSAAEQFERAKTLAQSQMPRKTTDVLRAARALIADPACWTRGLRARDAAGKRCAPDDRQAVVWCVIGALARVEHNRTERGFAEAALRARRSAS
jgi:hypothetical protein